MSWKNIQEKNKCIEECKNDDTYKYEFNNTCYINCPKNTIGNESNYICYDDGVEPIDRKMNEIKERMMILIKNASDNNLDIIESKEKNIVYQLTITKSQKINVYEDVSTINLGKYEEVLRRIYCINDNLSLIILKVDYYPNDTLIPIVGYEVFHPVNTSKLDLKYCDNYTIKLNIPALAEENKLFKYDPKSDFYNDDCFSYTTENGTDILIDDRKQEYMDKNLSLCEKKCEYIEYNITTKKSSCECFVKNEMELISEIINEPNKLSSNFEEKGISSSGNSNIDSIKCTKVLFSSDGLKTNISSYILFLFIGYFLFSILLFIKCGYSLLEMDIQDINFQKKI